MKIGKQTFGREETLIGRLKRVKSLVEKLESAVSELSSLDLENLSEKYPYGTNTLRYEIGKLQAALKNYSSLAKRFSIRKKYGIPYIPPAKYLECGPGYSPGDIEKLVRGSLKICQEILKNPVKYAEEQDERIRKFPGN